jgi:hypothetical protein
MKPLRRRRADVDCASLCLQECGAIRSKDGSGLARSETLGLFRTPTRIALTNHRDISGAHGVQKRSRITVAGEVSPALQRRFGMGPSTVAPDFVPIQNWRLVVISRLNYGNRGV